MIINHKVLVEQKENSIGIKIANALTEEGIYAVSHGKFTEKVFEEIERQRVNAIFIDNSGDEMTEEFETLLATRRTSVRVFVMTPEDAPTVLERNGVLFISASLGLSGIVNLLRYCLDYTGHQLENAITRTVLSIGIQPNLKGYRYLCTAVEKVVCNRDLMENVHYELYIILSNIHGVTTGSIERSIRNAVDMAYERHGGKIFNDFFGYYIGKPSNTELIGLLAEKVRIELGR